MSRSSTLIVLGTLIVLMPVSGIPLKYLSFLTVLLGAGVVAIGLSMRTRRPEPKSAPAEAISTPEQGTVTTETVEEQ